MLKKVILTAVAVTALTATAYAASWGDVDLDGTVTANDAACTLSYALAGEQTGYTDEQVALCDADGDGKVTANDAADILQYVLLGDKTDVTEDTTEVTSEVTSEVTTEVTTEATTQVTTETITETTTEATTEVTTSSYYDLRADELTVANLGSVISSNMVNGAYTIVPSFKVNVKEVEVNGEIYSQFIQLNGAGDTSSACVYFDVPSNGEVTVIARSSNASEVRSLVIMTDKGNSKTFDMPVSGDAPAVCTASVTANSRCYIYGGMGNINIYRITYTTNGEIPTVTETTTEATTKATTEATTKATTEATTRVTETTTETTTFNGDTSDGIVVTDFSGLKSALSDTSNKKIYVQGTINCSENIKLASNNTNVEIYGLTNDDGTAATLDFTTFRDSRTSRGSGGTGITLSGSYYTFRNLIIEKAGDCGIRITGNHNTFENCVFRYNNNSGVSITNGGAYNTFRYVDSYRNADLAGRYGADADGFSVKLSAGAENNFYNCRAWENSDDGWDSYDRDTPYIGAVYYEECVAWNNGNPYVFTGEYDYEQGNALDTNLIYVQAILNSDSDFESKYNAHTVTSWPEVTVKLLGLTAEYSKIHGTEWEGNPNGFKFGSAKTPSTSYRYIKNCIAFGHKDNPHQTPAKGFDQNSGSAGYDIVNALSFDNTLNYWMDQMSAKSMTGVFYSFNGEQDDINGDLTLTTPSAEKEAQIRQEVSDKTGYILDMVYSNKIPGEVIFNVFD